ncbi:MAG: hypothetical protein MRERV_89c002 [Mycoplasmataceae bacterium RV_VA103A]|nr:MAG: hypothetical protein MRERV_89c002 [Mycoplasmataceae bacterium RV_VA103A]
MSLLCFSFVFGHVFYPNWPIWYISSIRFRQLIFNVLYLVLWIHTNFSTNFYNNYYFAVSRRNIIILFDFLFVFIQYFQFIIHFRVFFQLNSAFCRAKFPISKTFNFFHT